VTRRLTPTHRLGLAAFAVVAIGAVLGADRTLPGEVGLTELANDLPAPVIDVLEIVMQLGSRPAILLVALVTAVLSDRRRLRVALAVLVAGGLAWVGSVLLAEAVERPRPPAAGASVVVRDDLDGFAYPSSHVSIATASLTAAALISRRRPGAAMATGGIVGLGRMAVGVQLPLDVVGGVGLGVAVAVLVVDVVDR